MQSFNTKIQSLASLFCSGGVRLCPLGTRASIRPIVLAPDGGRWWVGSGRWNENWQGKPKYSKKTLLSAALSTTNPTWRFLSWKPSGCGGNPATNHVTYANGPKFRVAYCVFNKSQRNKTELETRRCRGWYNETSATGVARRNKFVDTVLPAEQASDEIVHSCTPLSPPATTSQYRCEPCAGLGRLRASSGPNNAHQEST
jgi:hypothetical protein